jgi:hypothetical protein
MSASPTIKRAVQAVLTAAALSAALLAAPLPAVAQTAYFFPQTATTADLDPAIPTPEAFLGYPIGSHYTRHDQVVAYLRELDRLSDRITVQEIGRSYEERPLLAVFVTSAANQ